MMSRVRAVTGLLGVGMGKGKGARSQRGAPVPVTFSEVIMRIITAVALSTTALSLVMPGCTAERASAIDVSESVQEVNGVADENDPWGACVVNDTQTEGIFPGSCSNGGLCDALRGALGCTSWEQGLCPYGNFWATCLHECEDNSDCPSPQTGTAQPECGNGRCQLPCDASTDCPDGFACYDTGGHVGYDNWVAGITAKFCAQYIEVGPFELPDPLPGDPLHPPPPSKPTEPVGVADESDPWGACVVNDTQSDGEFPGTCSSTGGVCEGTSEIGYDSGPGGDYPFGNFWVTCQHACEEDSDCPVPGTGTAEPECGIVGCQLPCDDNTTCPDGFFCFDDGGYADDGSRDYCVQYIEVEGFTLADESGL